MGNDELKTLLSIYLNPEFENEESVSENLAEAGIDVDKFIYEMTEKIEEAEAKGRLKEGKKFKEMFYKLFEEGFEREPDGELLEMMNFGFRKLSGELTEEELDEIKKDEKKMAILKKILGG